MRHVEGSDPLSSKRRSETRQQAGTVQTKQPASFGSTVQLSVVTHSLCCRGVYLDWNGTVGFTRRQKANLVMESRKLVIIGDGACGKTSLLSVFTLGYFPTVSLLPFCPIQHR